MTNLHAWTHRRKRDGGTDPLDWDRILVEKTQWPPIFMALHHPSTTYFPKYRKMPGGIVATDSKEWLVNALADSTSYRPAEGGMDSQTAASAAAAAVSVRVHPIADLDLTPGLPYHIYVGYRSASTATNPTISVSIEAAGNGAWLTGGEVAITDEDLFDFATAATLNNAVNAQSWYGYTGVQDGTYAAVSMWNWDKLNDLVEFKLFKTAGTGNVYLNWMLFVPALDHHFPMVKDGTQYAAILAGGEGSNYVFAGQFALGPTATGANTDNSGSFNDRNKTLVDTQSVTAMYQALPSENGLGMSANGGAFAPGAGLMSNRHGCMAMLTFARAHSAGAPDDAYCHINRVDNHALTHGVVVNKNWWPIIFNSTQWDSSELGISGYTVDNTAPAYMADLWSVDAADSVETHIQRYHYVSVSDGPNP